MENAASDTPELLNRLLHIRGELRSQIRDAEGLTYKLMGPRPGGESSPKSVEPPPSMRSLIVDINLCVKRLRDHTAEHHRILGEPTADKSSQAEVC